MGQLAANGGPAIRDVPFPPWPDYDESERTALGRVLDSRKWWATEGTEVRAFEDEWASYTKAQGAVAVTNGTHALELALLGLGIGAGDEVIVPAWSFMATIAAVLAINAIPIVVDIDAITGTIDPQAVSKAVTDRTRAILPVHIAGSMADMDAVLDIAASNDLLVLEDAAHAHGSTWGGVHAGTLGDAGTFSFQASKLMTAGEGGAVVSSRSDLIDRVRSLGDCGRRPGTWYYRHFELAENLRMTEWQGAVLRAQLGRFPAQQARRAGNADFLNHALAEIPGVAPQGRFDKCTSQGNYCYVVSFDPEMFRDRDRVRTALLAEGMPLTTAYPPLHMLDMFSETGGLGPRLRRNGSHPDYTAYSMPVAERLAETTIWFETAVLMGSREDAQSVVDAIEKVFTCKDELAQLQPTAF